MIVEKEKKKEHLQIAKHPQVSSPSAAATNSMAGLWRGILHICNGIFDKLWTRSVTCKAVSTPLAEEMAAEKTSRMPTKPLHEPVSEEMVVEIFSRMPAECLHQCKQVYDDWDALLSTTYFNHNVFLPRASPTIIVHRAPMNGYKLFYVDDDCRGGLMCTLISAGEPNMPLDSPNCLPITELWPVKFSCYGLLFVGAPCISNARTAVINPITQRWVYLKHHFNVEGDICGVFFHPVVKEFRVLWVSLWLTWSTFAWVEFKLLSPRSESRPELNWRALAEIIYRPFTDEPPVNLHECLHWISSEGNVAIWMQSILVFSIVNEEFKVMPSINIANRRQDRLMHLLDLDGCLSLWQLTDVINIWIVEDYYTSWSWTKRYSVDVKLLHKRINIDEVSVVGVQNGALVIHWVGKGIFVYHLQHNTTKKYLFDKLRGKGRSFTAVFLHTKSLISMTGFRLDIDKNCPFLM